MKFFLLLLLLTSWTHLGSEAHICDSNATLKNHLVNIEESRTAGADAFFIKAYKSDNLESCLNDCCSAKYGACTVASYKNGGRDWTCIHCFCKPISLCKFFQTNVADSFIFHFKNDSKHDIIENLVTPTVKAINDLLKDHERSITARKGVENFIESAIQIKKNISEQVSTTEDADDITVKPRKGVDFYNITNHLSTVSVIKPRKGVETEDSFTISNPNSKIKPRKGVIPFQSSTPLPTMPSINETLQTDIQDDMYNKSNLLVFLKDVFSDDPNVTEVDTKVPEYKFTSPSSIKPSVITNLVKNISTLVHHISSSTNTMIHHISSSTQRTPLISSFSTVPQESYTIDTTNTRKTSFPISSSIATPQLGTSMFRDQSNLISSSSKSSLFITQIASQEPYTISPSRTQSNLQPSLLSSFTIENTAYFNTKLIGETLNSETKSSKKDIDDNERRYKSSMHLVFALVFGLLVVFGVFGAIVKRVYDVWVRRHYRRMDFLIDGMYDGYS